jgi:hypothetical protein
MLARLQHQAGFASGEEKPPGIDAGECFKRRMAQSANGSSDQEQSIHRILGVYIDLIKLILIRNHTSMLRFTMGDTTLVRVCIRQVAETWGKYDKHPKIIDIS